MKAFAHLQHPLVAAAIVTAACFGTLAKAQTLPPPPPTSAAPGCTAAPCSAPSKAQVEALLGKIENLYPSYFAASRATATVTTKIGADDVNYRTYANASAGLGTYQGGLWYYMPGSNWMRLGTLDDANALFCNSTCWSNANTAAFNMQQTLSDGAQRTTLAFSGLAMLTGTLEGQTFLPPGKVADYTGFQYLRDNDPDNMGHNTSFLTRVANNVILQLNDAQFAQLKDLAAAQLTQINEYGYKRYPLMHAFRRIVDSNIPVGSAGLNLNAVKKASKELYLIDGQISYDRAVLYSKIINSFDASQRAYFDAMKGKGWNSWPDVQAAQVAAKMRGLAQGTSVAIMTYASDLYSWYAGSLEADVYFCPERHGTYYGGFYIKDAPAIGHEGYAIDEQLTATSGAALSDSSKGYVTTAQAALMSSLVATQKDKLYAIVTTRTNIAALLRSLLKVGGASETVKSQVLALSATYGELDGANNHAYATTFAQVYQTLTAAQKAQMAALRKSIMSGTYADGTAFDFSTSAMPYLYSEPIRDTSVLMPYIGNTDYLFFEPAQ